MDAAKWQNIKNVMSAMLDLPESERAGFLALETDKEVRAEVEKLLSAHERAGGFIDKPILIEQGIAEDESKDNFIGGRIENYLILERLGAGGMGAVYLAKRVNSDFKQKVALKLIKRGMDSEAIVKRFASERKILSTLKHPNIAQLIDGGISSEGLPFFVMEYVEGKPLNQFCNENNLELKARLEIFRRICAAVDYAHKNLVVHRDLKPSNILVTEDGTPKLLDFGIAKLLTDKDAETTAAQGKILTPEYASPEQILGRTVTTASDVYSLGVILYELLAQHRPFDVKGKSFEEIVKSVCQTEPPKPSETTSNQNPTTENELDTFHILKNSLRGDLDNIILKALRKEPEERYGSVQQFAEDISRFLRGLPVLARSQTFQYRFQKYVKRHRAGVFAAALVLLSLVSGISIAMWQAIVARRERAKAEQHYNELRALAKSLLTETNAALDKLPESLEIRKSILEKSVAVLDSLAKEEAPDADFFDELADAYDKLGYIRHWSFRENEKALEDFGKSLALREKSLGQNSSNIKTRQKITQTLGSIFEVYEINGDTEKILEITEKIRSNYEEIFSLEPENTQNLSNLSADFERTGDYLKNAGREKESAEKYRQSVELIDRAIEIQKNNPVSSDGQTALVSFLMQKGILSEKFGRDDEALEIYGQAARLAEKTYRADDSQMYAFNHASRTHRLMADIYRKKGDWQKVLENYEFSLSWLKENKKNPKLDLKNMPYGIAIFTVRVGVALDKLGQQELGLAKVEEGLNLYREFLKPYAKDATVIINAPEFLEIVSDFYIETGQTAKGVEIWDEFTARVETFAEKNPGDNGIRQYLSYATRKKGDVLSGFDSRTQKMKKTNAKNLPQAKVFYEKSLEILRTVYIKSPLNFVTKKMETELIERIKKCG